VLVREPELQLAQELKQRAQQLVQELKQRAQQLAQELKGLAPQVLMAQELKCVVLL
jgi:flagellum-specific peptidoglycan hydrolase FlgJ